jgi:diguanylate cyclase
MNVGWGAMSVYAATPAQRVNLAPSDMPATNRTSQQPTPTEQHPDEIPRARHAGGERGTSAHSAFWLMTRRVTVLAATVDVALLGFFLAVHSPLLAWLNVASIAMYAMAYALLTRRRNFAALVLIWTEVLAHAAIGTMLVGWDSGFNYYLLMFIPAIVVSGSGRRMYVPLALLFAAYLGLHWAAQLFGSLTPLGDAPLLALNVFNVSIFFCMASYTARFYYTLVRKTEAKLRELATRDTLTGLANRRHLLDVARHEIALAVRTGQPLSVVLADIDDFKRINDGHGHDAGDQVLIHASGLFRDICRAQDTVARWGGEEFLFLLPATNEPGAHEFAERVRARVSATQAGHAGEFFTFSISMGVATLAGGESLESAIGRADDALYRSKSDGRDRVTVARQPMFGDVANSISAAQALSV